MYRLADRQLWKGRIDDGQDPAGFRFHQVVEIKESNNLQQNDNAFGLIGFSSDEGVRRNKGRQGASDAPGVIRQALAKLPYHLHADTIDVGNVLCEGTELEKAQVELGKHIGALFDAALTPIILGGGHETLYGHYLGVRKYLGSESKLGIINIDAHFDMRDDALPSSGTMFRQIMETDTNAGYLCLGIQKFGNTQKLFDNADHYGCQYLLQNEVETQSFQRIQEKIDGFIKNYDYIMLTLCSDSIMASDAPGVSAPSPLGLDPKTVKRLLTYIAANEKTISFDISEVNPSVDENGKTVKLAAYLVAEVMKSFHPTTNMRLNHEEEMTKW